MDDSGFEAVIWVAVRVAPGGRDSPVEIHSLLSELPIAVMRVLEGLVLHDLHSFAPVALLMTVLADHIQLSDFVLQSKQRRQRGQPHLASDESPHCPPATGCPAANHIHLLLRKASSYLGLR